MGTVQSSPANRPSLVEEQEVISSVQVTGERGRIEEEKPNETSNENIEETSFIETSDSESESDDSDDEDEEDTERRLIFEDIKNLRLLAKDFHHPETSVIVDGITSARCYFDRYYAPVQEHIETSDYKTFVLNDSLALKKLASDYHHPESKVTSDDPTVFGSCYYYRLSSANVQEEVLFEEKEQILADTLSLKKLAVDYAHPEIPVSTTDPSSFGRNYFTSIAAIDKGYGDDSEERAQILADAAALKKLAVDYAHPEVSVSTADASVFARNYFSRPSANDDDDSEERAQILADAAALKKLAVDYAHPEVGVSITDANVFARNYFSRFSATEEEGDRLMEERGRVMADVTKLKCLATAYAHPEHGVTTTDPTAFGRNYFNMLSMSKPLEVPDVPCPTDETKDVTKAKTLDKQQSVTSKLSVMNDSLGNVKRSPSSVILFGLGDDDGSAY